MIDFKVKKLKSVNSPVSVHGVYPYRGKISSLDAMKIIEQIPKGTTLLDPFCGSGTILYESKKRGVNVIGCDQNPIANILSEGKLNIPENLDDVISEFELLKQKSNNISEDFSHLKSSKYFHKNSHNQICSMKEFYPEMSQYFKSCFFGAIALTARGCNHYKWTSSSVGKDINPKRDIDFFEKLLMKIKKHYFPISNSSSSRIINCDSRELSLNIDPNSIDFVYTSPPYFDCLDYTSYYTKIVYDILNLDRVEIRSNLIQNFKSYESDMSKVLNELYKVCKKGAQIIFVVGDKKIKGKVINGAQFFNKISPFKTSKIIDRSYSGTTSQIFDEINKTSRKEQIIIWTK